MKQFAIFAIVLVIASSVRIKSSAELSLESKVKALKKTGWGKVAVGLLELQLKTGGPLAELITAFQNLIKDLNFKLRSEQEEYRWAAAEHHELDKEINFRLRDAKVRFGVAQAHLQNTLYPQRAQLEELIAIDEKLIADTEAAIAKATRERAEAQAFYEQLCVEHDDALGAVGECMELVAGLQSGGSFIEIKRAKSNLKKLHTKLKGFSATAHLAKALVLIMQDFADKSATQKVYDLLADLETNLHESRAAADQANVEQIAVFEHFLEVSHNTIDMAQARLDANNAALDLVNADIAHQEDLRDTAASDRDTAQADLDEETARWEAVEVAYKAYMAQLQVELGAIDQVIELFSTADLSGDMLATMDAF